MSYRTPPNVSPHWIHRLEDRNADDVVASRGTIFDDGRIVDYYTTQPSARQWIALGVVPLLAGLDGIEATHRVIVGTGSTEADAIESLRERLTPVLASSASSPLAEPFIAASQPSDWFG